MSAMSRLAYAKANQITIPAIPAITNESAILAKTEYVNGRGNRDALIGLTDAGELIWVATINHPEKPASPGCVWVKAPFLDPLAKAGVISFTNCFEYYKGKVVYECTILV